MTVCMLLYAQVLSFIVHQRSRLNSDRKVYVGVSALLAMVTSSLGLAIGALCPTGELSLSVGPALMIVYLIAGAIGPSGAGSTANNMIL